MDFKTLGDDRGSLIALESGYNAPFDIKRVYYIFDTKKNVTRGFHAHKTLKQVIIPVRGSCSFFLDDGSQRTELILDNPNQGLYIEGLIWREMKNFSEDCTLVVIASEHYNELDYVREYDVFLELVRNEKLL